LFFGVSWEHRIKFVGTNSCFPEHGALIVFHGLVSKLLCCYFILFFIYTILKI
jgi:hypothetical protein